MEPEWRHLCPKIPPGLFHLTAKVNTAHAASLHPPAGESRSPFLSSSCPLRSQGAPLATPCPQGPVPLKGSCCPHPSTSWLCSLAFSRFLDVAREDPAAPGGSWEGCARDRLPSAQQQAPTGLLSAQSQVSGDGCSLVNVPKPLRPLLSAFGLRRYPADLRGSLAFSVPACLCGWLAFHLGIGNAGHPRTFLGLLI